MNPEKWSIGRNKHIRGALLILASALAWVSGTALFISTRGINERLALPGMRYMMVFSHFVPWLIGLAFVGKLRKQDAANQSATHSAWECLTITLVLTYIVLLDVELTLTMALRH